MGHDPINVSHVHCDTKETLANLPDIYLFFPTWVLTTQTGDARILHNYIGIFWGSSTDLVRPGGEVTFTMLPKPSTRYYALFRLLRASAVQKV
jgi:hypothetical protein